MREAAFDCHDFKYSHHRRSIVQCKVDLQPKVHLHLAGSELLSQPTLPNRCPQFEYVSCDDYDQQPAWDTCTIKRVSASSWLQGARKSMSSCCGTWRMFSPSVNTDDCASIFRVWWEVSMGNLECFARVHWWTSYSGKCTHKHPRDFPPCCWEICDSSLWQDKQCHIYW